MKATKLYKTTIIIDQINGFNPDKEIQDHIMITKLVVADNEESAKNKLFGRLMNEYQTILKHKSFTVSKKAELVEDEIIF